MSHHGPENWPPMRPQARPWTRWWWPGSAVDKPTITRLLETYHEAGLGGVEITSIYGVQGHEHRTIPYLSPEWIGMVRHAIAEAHRLGMQVDLPPGSGWRIGGPFIDRSRGGSALSIAGAESPSGCRATCRPTDEQVKRAGPGGQGRAFNPFSRASLQAVINHFTPAFGGLDIRAQFHDSWEYQSSGCPELFDEFRRRRGYDLADHLADLVGDGGAERRARATYDVQLTLAELALEAFVAPWTEWCRDLGQMSRNQAHGSPGNWLDLYAAADIPETEGFREPTADTPLVSKFASSAAHVTGRTLVASETGTWLREHFHVSPGDLRRLIDVLFAAGINHHVYHGTAYSPPDAPWPGWLFYASAQINPQNPLWPHFADLNRYVARCQSVLQSGSSDNDLLVYFPVHDVLHRPDRKFGELLTINGEWFRYIADAAEVFRRLWRRGYAFDYVSDRQIASLATDQNGRLVAPGGTYRALLVPPCRYLPVETLDRLVELAGRGVPVIFAAPVAADVPGLARLDERRERLHELMAAISSSADCEAALDAAGVCREPMTDSPGLIWARRRWEGGHHYFITNQSATPIDAWHPLAVACRSALVMDPASGRTGLAAMRPCGGGNEVRLQLAPGESWLLRTFEACGTTAAPWRYADAAGPAHELRGTWRVTFLSGEGDLPPAYETNVLASWTDRGGAAEQFAGTALYRLHFDAPPEGGPNWLLDLGDVRSAARVRLNGDRLDTPIGPAFRIRLPELRPTGNVLEVEVTNLAANRIRHFDRTGVAWKVFGDINFVDRDYRPFDASGWPLEASGLLGPVRLVALEP